MGQWVIVKRNLRKFLDFKQSWDCTNYKYFWSWAKSILHHEMIVHLCVLWAECWFNKSEWEISPICKFMNLSSWYPAISTVWVDYWTFMGFSVVGESTLLLLGLKILLAQVTLYLIFLCIVCGLKSAISQLPALTTTLC